jgi:hypothetical protein
MVRIDDYAPVRPSPDDAEAFVRAQAVRTVAEASRDAADTTLLLDVLGLHAAEGARHPAAATPEIP